MKLLIALLALTALCFVPDSCSKKQETQNVGVIIKAQPPTDNFVTITILTSTNGTNWDEHKLKLETTNCAVYDFRKIPSWILMKQK